jgi:23S rRNA (cytidine1920-2'-O)/16S rRNA (cytidine1409-2'-O)-methyltransferase
VAVVKKRADDCLVELGLAPNKSKASAWILAGLVERVDVASGLASQVLKAGEAINLALTQLRVKDGAFQKDVGRGAEKLRHAFREWPDVRVEGADCLDIGSSTGGFTQVLLEQGAGRVLALDVGTHQLHESLRANSKVVSRENQHVLRVTQDLLVEWGFAKPFGCLVTDVSFISLTKILAHCCSWLEAGASWICLIKPQFELSPAQVPGGIVKNPKFHDEALNKVFRAAEETRCLDLKACVPSPILGGEGNKEFLACFRKY